MQDAMGAPIAKKHRLDRNQLSVDGKKHRLNQWSSEEKKS
jgi:hypothetical protein